MNESRFCSELIIWIEDNISERLLHDDIAIKSGYSKWHLQRVFKKNTGTPLGLFIKRKKLEYAYHDIMVKEETITDIAVKYGYESLQAFSRAFTRHYRLPPSIIRKKGVENK
ncbi:helix-turn-helix domain-containing protein [Leclercia adecarboxylata]|uniref:helix-turn-helix domain-containing protein n=1 Tax=Leclercia adecarboxylata TaxID=83655 RepID=UPI00124F642C|nr:helix-turn-helix domain-containing protein [Leclercia adecarboxylata]QFH49297.1 helix-turn-helix domain-containing protein [Leclercia adecarboxylata]